MMAQISVTHRFPAAPEQVFDAWLDPDVASRFLFATHDGEMIRVEIEPTIGGQFTFVDRRPDMGDVLHTGVYLEIDRPRRLAFAFAVPQFDPDFSMVTVEIAPSPGGGSDVTLTQARVPVEWADRSQEGWGKILSSLEAALG